MKEFQGRTAVITGAGSGFGLEASRIAAGLGMNIVMADVQRDALDAAVAQIGALGAAVLPFVLDVSKAEQVEAMGAATMARSTPSRKSAGTGLAPKSSSPPITS